MVGMRRGAIPAAVVAALVLAACGSSPTAPSGSGGVVVRGVLLGEGATFAASSTDSSAASGGTITVTIEGTSISTTITGNGTFELDGVPAGTFTLVFTRDGQEIGRISVTAGVGVEVKIVVKVEDTEVVLVDLELDGDNDPASKTCLIEGGRAGDRIELEGDVQSGTSAEFLMVAGGNRSRGKTIRVTTSGATNFKCNGPRSGGDCKDSVGRGAKVHVRGTLETCTLDDAEIAASEVKVQKAASGS
jgi:hypothetical protein